MSNNSFSKILCLLVAVMMLVCSCGYAPNETLVTDTDSEAILESLGITVGEQHKDISEHSPDFFNNSENEEIKPQDYDDGNDISEIVATEENEIGTKSESETETTDVSVVIDNDNDRESVTADNDESSRYILNIKSKKFHYPSCRGVTTMKESNKKYFNGSREEAISQGYSSCGICTP